MHALPAARVVEGRRFGDTARHEDPARGCRMTAEVQEKTEPKYYVVKRHLLGLLPDFSPGVPLPTERELAAALSTSRTTVRQALTELVTEGRLVRRHGSGTYVAEPKLAWPLQMQSFTAQA